MVLPYAGVDATTVDEETAVNPYIGGPAPAHLSQNRPTVDQRRSRPMGVQSKPGPGYNFEINGGPQPTGGGASMGGGVPAPQSTPRGALPSSPTPPAANGGRTNPYDTQNWGVPAMEGGAAAMIEGSRPGSTLASSVGKGIQAFTSGMKETKKAAEDWMDKRELLELKRKEGATKGVVAQAQLTAAAAKLKTASYAKLTGFQKELLSTTDPSTGQPVVQGSAYYNKMMNENWRKQDSEAVAIIKSMMGMNKDVNKKLVDRYAGYLEQGDAGLQTLNVAARIEEVLVSGNVSTGGAVPQVQKLRSMIKGLTTVDFAGAYKQIFGKDLGDLSDAQLLTGLSNAQAAATLADKALGHNPSNRDLEVILSTLPRLGLELEASLALANEIKKMAKKKIENGQDGYKFFKDKEADLPGSERFETRRKELYGRVAGIHSGLRKRVGEALTAEWIATRPGGVGKVPDPGDADWDEFVAFRKSQSEQESPLGRQIRAAATMARLNK